MLCPPPLHLCRLWSCCSAHRFCRAHGRARPAGCWPLSACLQAPPAAAQLSRRPTLLPPATHQVQLKFVMDKDGNPTRLGAGSQGVVYKVRCAAVCPAVHAVHAVYDAHAA